MMQPPIQKTSFKTVQSPRVKYISPKEVALLISGQKISDRKTILRTTSQKPSEQKTVDKSQWNSFNDVRCSQAHTPDKEHRTLYDEIAMNNLTGGSGYVSVNDYGNTGIQEENFTNCLASETCGRQAVYATDKSAQHGSSNLCMLSPKVETWASPVDRTCSTNGGMHLSSSCSKGKRITIEAIEEKVEEIEEELDAICKDRVGF